MVMMMVLTIGFLPWRVEPMTALAGTPSAGAVALVHWDEPARIRGSRRWRASIIVGWPPIVGGLPALVQDCPDDVGHKVGPDPPVQLGGQGRSHHGRQLPAVVRLWNPKLPRPRRPPTDARPVLAVNGQDRRQDRHPRHS